MRTDTDSRIIIHSVHELHLPGTVYDNYTYSQRVVQKTRHLYGAAVDRVPLRTLQQKDAIILRDEK